MKHPYHDYTLAQALHLARNLVHGPIPGPDAPTPTLDEAIVAIQRQRRVCGFNWITGRVAEEVLRSARGEKVTFR